MVHVLILSTRSTRWWVGGIRALRCCESFSDTGGEGKVNSRGQLPVMSSYRATVGSPVTSGAVWQLHPSEPSQEVESGLLGCLHGYGDLQLIHPAFVIKKLIWGSLCRSLPYLVRSSVPWPRPSVSTWDFNPWRPWWSGQHRWEALAVRFLVESGVSRQPALAPYWICRGVVHTRAIHVRWGPAETALISNEKCWM